jgi:DNA-directed RNA polymerase specialized sigma24 family protein/rubredoxin
MMFMKTALATHAFETFKEILSAPETNNRKKGSRLNHLCAQYLAATNKEYFESLLLEEIRDFSVRTILKEFPAFRTDGSYEDVTQAATITAWLAIQDNNETLGLKARLSEWLNTSWIKELTADNFSGWVYTIIRHAALDFKEGKKSRKEDELLPYKAYSNSGISRASFKNDKFGEPVVQDIQGIPSKTQQNATSNGLNSEFDLESAIRKLGYQDQQLVDLVRQGYRTDDKELTDRFNCTSKQLYNRWSRIKLVLKDELVGFPTVIHTCNPSVTSTNDFQRLGQYIEDSSKSFQALPESCKCRKSITRVQARKMVETGAAEWVYKVDAAGKPVINYERIWSRRAVRVRRVMAGAGQTQMERMVDGNRQDLANREIGRQMDEAFIQGLIVPFRPDPWEGIVRFTNFQDKETPNCYRKSANTPQESVSPNPNKPFAEISNNETCPKCSDRSLLVSTDEEGAVRHECQPTAGRRFACTYRQVWAPRKDTNMDSSPWRYWREKQKELALKERFQETGVSTRYCSEGRRTFQGVTPETSSIPTGMQVTIPEPVGHFSDFSNQ